jgi:hypothetical protein
VTETQTSVFSADAAANSGSKRKSTTTSAPKSKPGQGPAKRARPASDTEEATESEVSDTEDAQSSDTEENSSDSDSSATQERKGKAPSERKGKKAPSEEEEADEDDVYLQATLAVDEEPEPVQKKRGRPRKSEPKAAVHTVRKHVAPASSDESEEKDEEEEESEDNEPVSKPKHKPAGKAATSKVRQPRVLVGVDSDSDEPPKRAVASSRTSHAAAVSESGAGGRPKRARNICAKCSSVSTTVWHDADTGERYSATTVPSGAPVICDACV